jgi:hypothetical protein
MDRLPLVGDCNCEFRLIWRRISQCWNMAEAQVFRGQFPARRYPDLSAPSALVKGT